MGGSNNSTSTSSSGTTGDSGTTSGGGGSDWTDVSGVPAGDESLSSPPDCDSSNAEQSLNRQ